MQIKEFYSVSNHNQIKKVCVYCASSSKVDECYFLAARMLGNLLVCRGISCICGAGNQGLMGALTDAVLETGGEMTGIIPHFMYDEGWYHTGLTDLVVTESMHERKTRMAECSDAVIALPGGCGTMEELLEMITWKQLGLFFGPIVILNTNRYYDPLLQMLRKSVGENFMRPEHEWMWQVVDTPQEAVEALFTTPQWRSDARNMAAI